MYKLANQVLDVYDDLEMTTLRKLATINSNINVIEKEKLCDDDYALSIITKKASKLNKFPVDSYDSTWLSNQYFEENCSKLPKLAQEIAANNIKLACTVFRIEPAPSVEKLAKPHWTNVYFEEDGKINKKAEARDYRKFAEIEKICNNDVFAKYAFATPEDVKLASDYFDQYHTKLPVEYRHKYASAIQRRAGELGLSMKGQIEKYAGNSYNAHVLAHLSSRKNLVDGKYATAMDKLGEMKNDIPPIEFASLLHQLDKRAGLDKYYGSYLTNPYEATFTTQPNPKCLFKTAGGKKVTVDNIGTLFTEKYDKIKEYFGKDLADSLKKDPADIFESLPNDAKEVISGIANGSL